MNLAESEIAPGTVGPLLDEVPLLTVAMIRPYVVAAVLHRGAVRAEELYAALTPHCATTDLQTGAWSAIEGDYLDCTRLELLVGEALGEFVSAGRLRYNCQKNMWVADEKALVYWVTKASELDAHLPRHILSRANARNLNTRCPF
jgi:hypothetical protein